MEPLSLKPEHLLRLPERVDAEGPIRETASDPDFHDRTARDILARLDGAPLWVFAIGSLIWNPRCNVVESRPARVEGWQRAFCLGPIRRWRGNPEAPGLMLSLDEGGECHGVAMRVEADDMLNEVTELLKTEPPFAPSWVDAETNDGLIPAIAFTVNQESILYTPEPDLDALVEMFATAVGTGGTMVEYLLNTVLELERHGVHDPHLWTLQERVAAYLDGQPPVR